MEKCGSIRKKHGKNQREREREEDKKTNETVNVYVDR